MRKYFSIFVFSILQLVFLIVPIQALAQTCDSGFHNVAGVCVPDAKGGGYASQTDFFMLLAKVIGTLLQISGGIAVLFVIYGGFMYMTSGGNEEQAKKGRNTLIYALGGIAVIVLAYALVNLVVTTVTK